MKKLLVLILFFFVGYQSFSFVPTDNTRLSILVCSPGEDLYAKFGHAALRICDEEQNFDFVFDYGTFSIEDIFQFVGNFFTGKTYYLLDAKDYRYTTLAYSFEGRGIVEYPLNLTFEEKKEVCNFVRINMLPQNREYLYNFFYDNCATRLRDILQTHVGGLSWNASYDEERWRSVILRYVGQTSWASLGIHLALGVPTDTLAAKEELLFLPDAIASVCETATRNDGRKLCGPAQVVVESNLESGKDDGAVVPLVLFFILILILTTLEFYKKRWFVALDVLLFVVFGILGCVLWFLSFVSIHSFVYPNCNTLWLTPFHLIFALLLFIPSLRKYAEWYLLFASIMAIVYVIISLVVGQFIPKLVYLLLAIMVVRGTRALYFHVLKKEKL
ncbi:MAG: DUF4105 domain-containing protein [Bacteroidales bacterium]|nr:DUF4105 domain-containing protein [Bacteroidales bacterium]